MQTNKVQDAGQKKNIVCESCTYEFNAIHLEKCGICGHPLSSKLVANKATNFDDRLDQLKAKKKRAKRNEEDKVAANTKSGVSNLGAKKAKKSSQLSKPKKLADEFPRSVSKKTKKNEFRKLSKEIKHPLTFIVLTILGLVAFLWLSTLLSPERNSDVAKTIEQANQEETVAIEKKFPNGVFNYGGTPLYAALVSNGLNTAIEAQNPGTTLRFSKPLDDDHSGAKSVKLLLGKHLSFTFNNRPLIDPEYKKARLRNIVLQEAPIGTDGIVFFTNNNALVSGLNMSQVRDIYSGKVTNWKEIDSKAPDKPIVIVFSDKEEVEALGIDPSLIPDSAKHFSNYTQAIREVIGTPGAISFASASLIKGQQLIKILDLAEGNSRNFVSPFVKGKPNLEAFKNENYPATRTIFINYRDDDTLDSQTGISYVDFLNSPPGQEIIKASGFVPWGRSR